MGCELKIVAEKFVSIEYSLYLCTKKLKAHPKEMKGDSRAIYKRRMVNSQAIKAIKL